MSLLPTLLSRLLEEKAWHAKLWNIIMLQNTLVLPATMGYLWQLWPMEIPIGYWNRDGFPHRQ